MNLRSYKVICTVRSICFCKLKRFRLTISGFDALLCCDSEEKNIMSNSLQYVNTSRGCFPIGLNMNLLHILFKYGTSIRKHFSI